MEYLTRIIKIEHGKPIYSNEISDAQPVGEIRLQKYPSDNICNICLLKPPSGHFLTDDHVPPRCMGNKRIIHYINLFNYMFNQEIKYKGISKDGIKYNTICAKCNNELLKEYDDAINELYGNFRNAIPSNKIALRIKVKPNKIIRGILGHFLSCKTSHQRTITEDISLRV